MKIEEEESPLPDWSYSLAHFVINGQDFKIGYWYHKPSERGFWSQAAIGHIFNYIRNAILNKQFIEWEKVIAKKYNAKSPFFGDINTNDNLQGVFGTELRQAEREIDQNIKDANIELYTEQNLAEQLEKDYNEYEKAVESVETEKPKKKSKGRASKFLWP